MSFHLGSRTRTAATKLAISLAARRRTPLSCRRSLSASAISNQFYLPALTNAHSPISSKNHRLCQRRWMSEESPSSSSSSTSSPSDRLHSTDIAFKPAESGWGRSQKYANNFDNIFGGSKTKGSSSTSQATTEETSDKKMSTKDTATNSKS